MMAFHKSYTALDIGSSQITCIVGSVQQTDHPVGTVHIDAVSVQASGGIEKGRIVNMEKAEHAIAQCIEKAEKNIGKRITSVVVSIAGSMPKSHWIKEQVALSHKKVTDADMISLLHLCKKSHNIKEDSLVHITPYDYFVDSLETQNPRGILGKTLKGRIHMTTCDHTCLQNLHALLDKCSMTIQDTVVDSLASALGVLDGEEYDMSTVVVDIGAGVTSISVFFKGIFVYAKAIPLGGWHITNDIMQATATPLADAEHMKIKYGSAIVTDHMYLSRPIEYYRAGEKNTAAHAIHQETLATIINNRLEEIFTHVDKSLQRFTFASRLILTGGGANIENICALATQRLKRKVRIGKPSNTVALPDAYNTSTFSTAVGLLRFTGSKQAKKDSSVVKKSTLYKGHFLKRIYNWLKSEM